MTVAKYRDKILFPHDKDRIIARFKKFIKLHPDLEGRGRASQNGTVYRFAVRDKLAHRKRRKR